MESTYSDAHTLVEPGPTSVTPISTAPPLVIRWDRTAYAVVGLFALVAAVVSGALNMFQAGSVVLSWTALGIFIAVVAGLRTVAVRDRTRRQTAAFASTESATSNVSAAPATDTSAQRKMEVFDRVAGDEPAPTPVPWTAEELREAALRVAAQGTADAKLAHTQTVAAGELKTDTWEPVEVPKPGYVTAARAASETVPLVAPQVPKSAGTSIKATQAASGKSLAVSAASASASNASAYVSDVPKPAPSNHALNNLDDVLQRRRA